MKMLFESAALVLLKAERLARNVIQQKVAAADDALNFVKFCRFGAKFFLFFGYFLILVQSNAILMNCKNNDYDGLF